MIRYQHQLASIIAKIEKLENANKYPDLGPIGDSLITLMDTKLSKFDQRLHEISSKLSVNTTQTVTQPTVVVQSVTPTSKQQEHAKQIVQEKPKVEKLEIKIEAHEEKKEIQKENVQQSTPLIEIPIPERRRSVELSTLTEIPSKMPEFPAEFIRPIQTQVEATNTIVETTKDLLEQPQQIVPVEPTPLVNKETPSVPLELPKPAAEQVEKKIQLPTPIKIPEEEKIEDDDKDLDKIKSEIMRALSKLEQVEVE